MSAASDSTQSRTKAELWSEVKMLSTSRDFRRRILTRARADGACSLHQNAYNAVLDHPVMSSYDDSANGTRSVQVCQLCP